MMNSRFLFLLGAVLLLAATFPLFKTRPASIPWNTDFEAALEEARAGDKPVLTFLFTDWCGYCRRMDESTFRDESVIAELRDEFVWLRLNPETSRAGAALRGRFGVSGFPTILILDDGTSEIDRLLGFMPPQQFLSSARKAISSRQKTGAT